MELYLVRHGRAGPGDDETRELTDQARREVEVVASRLRASGVSPERIEHSPLVRAAQTAEIIAEKLKAPTLVAQDLRHGHNLFELRERLMAPTSVPIMLVGHNPMMEELAALLMVGTIDRLILTFHTASVAKLVATGDDTGFRPFACDWLVTPDLLG